MNGALGLTTAAIVVVLPTDTFAQRPATAFVDVTLIRMDQERIEPAHTVVVQADRIVAIGRTIDVPLPSNARVVDGKGLYLLPGLCDSHVHLTTDMPWAPVRREFKDAPLYLTHGVTTVVNLRGTAEQLDWRRRVEAGDLIGPTIYTAGEFVNEPRVVTVDDVRREVLAQARDGYDLIKFHEIWTQDGGFSTRDGLSRDAYLALFETARKAHLAVVGHVPINLGLEALLASSSGAVAHLGDLNRLHFVLGIPALISTAMAAAVLSAVVLGWGAVALKRRMRRTTRPITPSLRRAQQLFTVVMALVGLLLACGSALGPGGVFYTSSMLRVGAGLSGLATLLVVAVAVWVSVVAAAGGLPKRSLISLALAALSALAVAGLIACTWLPFLWRNSRQGIDHLAVQLRDAGIAVQTTLVVFDVVNAASADRVMSDPVFGALTPDTQALWRQIAQRRQSAIAPAMLPPRHREFLGDVAVTLQRNGVRLLAGTDAMGAPLILPGRALIRELQLLNESGLTPYEALRTATIDAARFLGQENEFGAIAVGRRADLVLLRSNPLESLAALDRVEGVMARGRWLPRETLQQMLSSLR